jgi:hypothetical protein
MMETEIRLKASRSSVAIVSTHGLPNLVLVYAEATACGAMPICVVEMNVRSSRSVS